jgi:hypothetical protein
MLEPFWEVVMKIRGTLAGLRNHFELLKCDGSQNRHLFRYLLQESIFQLPKQPLCSDELCTGGVSL